MARVDYWQTNYGQYVGTTGFLPLVLEVANLEPGDTLVRTRIDLQINQTDFYDQDILGYPDPGQGALVVAAVGWSTGAVPTGFFDSLDNDWLYVRQQNFDFTMYWEPVDLQSQYSVYVNSQECRNIDTHSMRKTDPVAGGSVYLVLDWAPPVPEEAAGFTPDITWIARVLAKRPAA
jgi:hypothetical protein